MLEDGFDENFKKWIPHENLDEVYDVEDIGFKDEGFRILCIPDHFEKDKSSDQNIELVWDNVIAYIVTDESYRPELWSSESDIVEVWSFYISESSDFLNKFREKNYIIPEKTYDFLIAGTNTMVDVISSDFPKIKFIEGD